MSQYQLPGTYERCMCGHYYACTRGDEECPICKKVASWNNRITQLEAENARLTAEIADALGPRMKLFYWEDPGGHGYDFVVQAKSQEEARTLAKKSYDGDPARQHFVFIALDSPPTGIFHYGVALPIFTECDPMASRLCQNELDKLKAAATERDALATRCGELERDKVRLDWLQENAPSGIGHVQDMETGEHRFYVDDVEYPDSHPTLREALDAAIKGALAASEPSTPK